LNKPKIAVEKKHTGRGALSVKKAVSFVTQTMLLTQGGTPPPSPMRGRRHAASNHANGGGAQEVPNLATLHGAANATTHHNPPKPLRSQGNTSKKENGAEASLLPGESLGFSPGK
jgi:hypothetical protein